MDKPTSRSALPTPITIVAWAVLLLYISLLLFLTLAPPLRPTADRINLIPLQSILAGLRRGGWQLYVNIIGNVLAFVPLGVLLPGILRRHSWLVVASIAALVSAAIEVLQWTLGLRVADIDDVLLNTLGALAGYLPLLAVSAIGRALR
jgi:glycopeptide antibiotics resistance protein